MHWLPALVVIGNLLILQESLLELLLELGWYLVKVGVLRTWTPPLNFDCPSSVFGNCHQFGRDHVLRVELYVAEFGCVHHVQLLKLCYQRIPFQLSLPAYQTYSKSVSGSTVLRNWWNFNRSKKKKQKWSDINSNEPNKIHWLNWLVEAPLVFFADGCNSSWNPSTVKWSIATVTQRFLPLFSVPLFSNLI